jgi:hypothetical protein
VTQNGTASTTPGTPPTIQINGDNPATAWSFPSKIRDVPNPQAAVQSRGAMLGASIDRDQSERLIGMGRYAHLLCLNSHIIVSAVFRNCFPHAAETVRNAPE